MSVVKILPGKSASASVAYVLYGRGAENAQHMRDGTNRAAAFACSMDSPEAFVELAEARALGLGRKNEVYNLIQSWSTDEFAPGDPRSVERVKAEAVKLAEAAFAADYLVVVHDDAAGGHLHSHIVVMNHDNATGKALKKNTSWVRGLHQLNDELMREGGYEVLPSPEKKQPEWELKRGTFEEGGFEITLGDHISDALRDPRSVDQETFEQVLGERGVRLRVTNRDGWSYSMRRADNNKWGRRKASSLSHEFTKEEVMQALEMKAKVHAQQAQAQARAQAQTREEPERELTFDELLAIKNRELARLAEELGVEMPSMQPKTEQKPSSEPQPKAEKREWLPRDEWIAQKQAEREAKKAEWVAQKQAEREAKKAEREAKKAEWVAQKKAEREEERRKRESLGVGADGRDYDKAFANGEVILDRDNMRATFKSLIDRFSLAEIAIALKMDRDELAAEVNKLSDYPLKKQVRDAVWAEAEKAKAEVDEAREKLNEVRKQRREDNDKVRAARMEKYEARRERDRANRERSKFANDAVREIENAEGVVAKLIVYAVMAAELNRFAEELEVLEYDLEGKIAHESDLQHQAEERQKRIEAQQANLDALTERMNARRETSNIARGKKPAGQRPFIPTPEPEPTKNEDDYEFGF